jgi:hypothetical protein
MSELTNTRGCKEDCTNLTPAAKMNCSLRAGDGSLGEISEDLEVRRRPDAQDKEVSKQGLIPVVFMIAVLTCSQNALKPASSYGRIRDQILANSVQMEETQMGRLKLETFQSTSHNDA